MSKSRKPQSDSTRARWILALVVAVGGLLLGATVLADRGGSSGADLTVTARTQAGSAPAGVNPRFWQEMVDAGLAAGLYDGYRECLEPQSGVMLFDIEQFGSLVNPAYDAGYMAAGHEIRAACADLVADAGHLEDDARVAHRETVTGASFDTGDAHPDFGKGDDLGRAVLVDLGCDLDRASELAAPPAAWRADHYSEFLDGYVGGLGSTAQTCG